MQAYCFRFYFLLVTVIIFCKTVWPKNINQGLIENVETNEVHSLVSTPRLIKAPGNGFSGNVKIFDAMPLHSQISMLCDLASWKKIQPDDCFITKPRWTWRSWHSVQRIYKKWYKIQNLLQNSRWNKIWASHWFKSRVIHGIEIQIPSIRDQNRFVDELEGRFQCQSSRHQFHFASTTSRIERSRCFRKGLPKLLATEQRSKLCEFQRIPFSSKQIKSISAAEEILQDTGINLGENEIYIYKYTEEDADRIHSQGNVELVEKKDSRNYVSYHGKYGFIPGEWSMDPSDGKKIHGAKEYLRGANKQGRKRQEEWTTILERWRKDDLYLTNQSWMDHWVREVFGPKKTRPNFTEAVETAKTISKEEWRVPDLNQCLPRTTARAISKEEWNMPQILVQERERLNDTVDPTIKEHLIWLSKNWPSCF